MSIVPLQKYFRPRLASRYSVDGLPVAGKRLWEERLFSPILDDKAM
jgi:hypothetical protein